MTKETVYRDDLTQEAGAEPRRFSLDGKQWEIDLTDASYKRLEGALAEFIAAARPVTSGTKAKSGSSRKSGTRSRSKSDGRTKAIRAWALEHGYQVGKVGKLPPDVIAAYEAANP